MFTTPAANNQPEGPVCASKQSRVDHAGYLNLTPKMVFFVVLVSIVPLIITGVITHTKFYRTYEEKVEYGLREQAKSHGRSIDSYLMSGLAELRTLSGAHSAAVFKEKDFLRKSLALLRKEHEGAFSDLGLVNPKGIQVSHAGHYPEAQTDYSQAAWFAPAMSRKEYISLVFTGPNASHQLIMTAKTNCARQCYLLKATVNYKAFEALVNSISLGRTGFAFIMDRTGAFKTQPRQEVFLNLGPYNELLAGRFDVKQIPVLESGEQNLQDSLFAFAPINGGAWILCLQQEAADAYADMHNTVATAITFITIFTAIILPVFIYLARQITRCLQSTAKKQATINEKVIETGQFASIGQLAAGIAHEINNPVAIMVEEAGWIGDILSEDNPLSGDDLTEIREATQQISTQGRRCKEITYKLLSFARKIAPAPQEVDLNLLVE